MTKSTEIGLVVIIILLFITIGVIEHSSNIQTEIMQEIIDDYEFMLISSLDENQAMSILIEKIVNDFNKTINRLEADKLNLEHEKAVLEHELKVADIRFHTAYDIDMRPTYAKVLAFLKEDETDDKTWTKEYDCTQFSHEVVRNAIDSGIFACIVTIDLDVPSDKYEYSGHNIIAFDTSDHGLQYFEPQNDKNVYMAVDMNYATYLGYSSDYKMWVVKYDSCFGIFE